MKKHYDDEQEDTTACRVRNLRLDREWSQKELADRVFVAHSQISRLESGETTNIGSSLLVALAKEFHVSTDYLLGLTPISVPKNYGRNAPSNLSKSASLFTSTLRHR